MKLESAGWHVQTAHIFLFFFYFNFIVLLYYFCLSLLAGKMFCPAFTVSDEQ